MSSTKSKTVNRIAATNGAAKKKVNHKIKKQEEQRSLQLIAPKMETVKVTLVGTSDLIVKQFGLKGPNSPGQQIIDKRAKRSPAAKEAVSPEDDFKASLYTMPKSKPAGEKGAKYGFPASGLKKAMMTAAGRYLMDGRRMNGKLVAGAVYVLPHGPGSDLMLINHGKDDPYMRTDAGRNPSTKGAVMIHRGAFSQWSIDVQIRYNATVLSQEQLATLIQWAGAAVGIGEWRAEKGGSYGTFELEVSK